MRVEIVPGLEVRRDQEDHLGVREVARRAIVAHPRLVADACVRRADVGVAVVAVDAPRLEHPLGVAVLAGPADVVHDLVAAVFFEGGADAAADLVERLIPRDPLPLTAAASPDPLHRVQDAFGVVDLVLRRRALGTVAPPARGVLGVALELGDLTGLVVDERREPARGFAVEAGGRHDRVVALHLVGPGLGVELGPVVPAIVRRMRCKCHGCSIRTRRVRPFVSISIWGFTNAERDTKGLTLLVMRGGRIGRRGRNCLRRRTCRTVRRGRRRRRATGWSCRWRSRRRAAPPAPRCR